MTHPPDPIEQLAAELTREHVGLFDEEIAKLIRVAAEAAVAHMEEVHHKCEERNASCWEDICQRIREGMAK